MKLNEAYNIILSEEIDKNALLKSLPKLGIGLGLGGGVSAYIYARYKSRLQTLQDQLDVCESEKCKEIIKNKIEELNYNMKSNIKKAMVGGGILGSVRAGREYYKNTNKPNTTNV